MSTYILLEKVGSRIKLHVQRKLIWYKTAYRIFNIKWNPHLTHIHNIKWNPHLTHRGLTVDPLCNILSRPTLSANLVVVCGLVYLVSC